MTNELRRLRRFDRRGFLIGSAVGTSALVAGCDLLSQEPATEDGDGADPAAQGNEAPTLAQMVDAGDLPPLEERLPSEAAVIELWEEPGVYGGTLNTYIGGPGDAFWVQRIIGYDYLVRWGGDNLEEVAPNLCASFEISDDGRGYTFRLREGLRWSDGEPFTADDIVFAQNDVLNNRELYPGEPDNPATAELVDQNTVRIVFKEPEGLFLQQQCSAYGGKALVTYPRHYLEQFHKDYNPDVQELVEQEGHDSWVPLFQTKAAGATDWTHEVPTINAWKITQGFADETRVVVERNPYYWKVDTERRQLPYIDGIRFEVVADQEVMLLQVTNGEIDWDTRYVNLNRNKPVLSRNREDGGYRLLDLQNGLMNTTMIAFNLAHKNPVKREVFNNKNFRIGLSHAINRQEIIDLAFQRQGEPYQCAPRPESAFYDEEMALQYTKYDLDLANEYLDRAGYTERNGDDIRLGPDGNPISLSISYATTAIYSPDDIEPVVEYWRGVGIDARVNPEDRTLFRQRQNANDHDVSVWAGAGGGLQAYDAILDPRGYVAVTGEALWGVQWNAWYQSGGEDGVEPPEPARQQMELYDQLLQTADPTQHFELMREILQIAKEQFWAIGLVLPPPDFGIAKENLRNVPPDMVNQIIAFHTPAAYHPEQFYVAR